MDPAVGGAFTVELGLGDFSSSPRRQRSPSVAVSHGDGGSSRGPVSWERVNFPAPVKRACARGLQPSAFSVPAPKLRSAREADAIGCYAAASEEAQRRRLAGERTDEVA
jgi:hypothetical protein